jgi:hypothetical protein
MKEENIITWNRNRKFGIELEFLNTDPHRAREWFKEKIAEVLLDEGVSYQKAQVRDWEHTHDNEGIWVCKTDSSCGYEVCTPPLKGPQELRLFGKVIDKFKTSGAKFNDSCGLHVHVSLKDFTDEQMYNVLMYWIKIEHNIANAHPEHRRKNVRYCELALNKVKNFKVNSSYSGHEVYDILRRGRGAINPAYWENRRTLEFRIGEMTLDSESIKNRVRFLITFIDTCKYLPTPDNLNLLSPKGMLRLLGLLDSESEVFSKKFSPAMISMRNWILDRIDTYIPNGRNSVWKDDKEMVAQLKGTLKNESELKDLGPEL